MLCDSFGRMMIEDTGGSVDGVAWNETYGLADDFNSEGRYSTEFNALRQEMNEIECLTGVDNTVVIDTGTEQVTLTFDQQANTYVPTVSELTDGTPNMFYRTLNDGTNDVDVLVDGDGKLCVVDGTKYITKSAQDEYVPELNAEKLTALTTAAGGSVAVTLEESTDTNMTKVTLGSYFFVINQDGYVTFSEVNVWRPYGRLFAVEGNNDEIYLGNNQGKALNFRHNNTDTYIQIYKPEESDVYEFSDYVSSLSSLESEFVESQWSNSNTIVDFTYEGVSYRMGLTGSGLENWITPYNIIDYE